MTAALVELPVEIQANRVPVDVGGETIYVGRLSVRQMLGIGRLLPGIFSSMPSDQAKSLVETAKSHKTQGAALSGDWSAILAFFDDAVIGNVLSALLSKPAEWCLDVCDIVSIGQIAEAVLDNNEVDTLKRVFSKATGSQMTSPTSSVPSA